MFCEVFVDLVECLPKLFHRDAGSRTHPLPGVGKEENERSTLQDLGRGKISVVDSGQCILNVLLGDDARMQ